MARTWNRVFFDSNDRKSDDVQHKLRRRKGSKNRPSQGARIRDAEFMKALQRGDFAFSAM